MEMNGIFLFSREKNNINSFQNIRKLYLQSLKDKVKFTFGLEVWLKW
jgi:hypothetical protein